MTIKAPDTVRQFQNTPPLNRANNDHINDAGVRISCPIYIDPPTSTIRKQWLSKLREMASESDITTEPDSMSGIKVVSYGTRQPAIEAALGVSLENLRNILFSRGGMSPDLVIKLQTITGIVAVTQKDIQTAFDQRKKLVKEFMSDFTFDND